MKLIEELQQLHKQSVINDSIFKEKQRLERIEKAKSRADVIILFIKNAILFKAKETLDTEYKYTFEIGENDLVIENVKKYFWDENCNVEYPEYYPDGNPYIIIDWSE